MWLGHHSVGTRTPSPPPPAGLKLASGVAEPHCQQRAPLHLHPSHPPSLTHTSSYLRTESRPSRYRRDRGRTPFVFVACTPITRAQVHTRVRMRENRNVHTIRAKGLPAGTDSGASVSSPGAGVPAQGSPEPGNINRNFYRNSESEGTGAEGYLQGGI